MQSFEEAFGVRPDDSKWRNAVNGALEDIVEDGTYKTIYAKYFSTPYDQLPEVWPRN